MGARQDDIINYRHTVEDPTKDINTRIIAIDTLIGLNLQFIGAKKDPQFSRMLMSWEFLLQEWRITSYPTREYLLKIRDLQRRIQKEPSIDEERKQDLVKRLSLEVVHQARELAQFGATEILTYGKIIHNLAYERADVSNPYVIVMSNTNMNNQDRRFKGDDEE